MSVGSVSNDFGTPGVGEHCHFLDSPHQAEAFRKDMLNVFLRYNAPQQDTQTRMVVGIVGAGAPAWSLPPNSTTPPRCSTAMASPRWRASTSKSI